MNQSVTRAELLARAAKMKKPETKPRFSFGKHNGSTVESVIKADPEYILWCWDNIDRRKLPFGRSEVLDADALIGDEDHDDLDLMDRYDGAL